MFEIVVNDNLGIKNLLTITGGVNYSIIYNNVEFANGMLPATIQMPQDVNGAIKKGIYTVTIDGVKHVFDYQYTPIPLSVDVLVNGFESSIRFDDTSVYGSSTVISRVLTIINPLNVSEDTSGNKSYTNIYSGNWIYDLKVSYEIGFPSNLKVTDYVTLHGERFVYNITQNNVFDAANNLKNEYIKNNRINITLAEKQENDVLSVQAELNSYYRYIISNDALNAYKCLESIAAIVNMSKEVKLIVPFTVTIGSSVDTYLSKLNAQDNPRYIQEMLGSSLEVKSNKIEATGSGKVSIAGEAVGFLGDKIDGDTLKTDGEKVFADITYSNSTPVPVTIGGIDSGSTFNKSSMQSMWDMLLYQYANPLINLITPSSQILEVGQTVSGDKTVSWSVSNKLNIKAGGYKMKYVPSDTIVFNEPNIDASSGTFTHPSTVRNVGSDVQIFKFYCTNTKDREVSVSVNYSWRHRIFFGESTSTSLTEATIKTLRINGIQASYLGQYSMIAGGYKYICVPVDMGVPSRFRDVSTGLLVPFEDPYAVNVTNQYGLSIAYNVFRTVNVLGGSINIEIY